jgi:hypothetical protein
MLAHSPIHSMSTNPQIRDPRMDPNVFHEASRPTMAPGLSVLAAPAMRSKYGKMIPMLIPGTSSTAAAVPNTVTT